MSASRPSRNFLIRNLAAAYSETMWISRRLFPSGVGIVHCRGEIANRLPGSVQPNDAVVGNVHWRKAFATSPVMTAPPAPQAQDWFHPALSFGWAAELLAG